MRLVSHYNRIWQVARPLAKSDFRIFPCNYSLFIIHYTLKHRSSYLLLNPILEFFLAIIHYSLYIKTS